MRHRAVFTAIVGLYSALAGASGDPPLSLSYSTSLAQPATGRAAEALPPETGPAIPSRPLGDTPFSLAAPPAPEPAVAAVADAPAPLPGGGGAPPGAPAAQAVSLPSPPEGASLPRVEIATPAAPAPAIDLTRPPEDLWLRMKHGFAMPNLTGDLVLHHQQWYLNRPDYLRRMVERSKRYLHHILDELEARGMPSELALLPMVESAFNPMAYSRAHASGLWQFIPSTGKNYKLKQDWWVDERRDIVASTSAALDYLQTIYDMHGDWFLALASYNWGEGAVARAIRKNEARGLPTDYQSLTMPNETRHYVPKLQALKNIFSDRALLAGLDLPPIPNRPYFATVEAPATIDVKVAARLAEMPVEEFVALNPAHNRPVIVGDAQLVLPRDKVNTFMSNLEEHQSADKPLSAWQAYTLKPGEDLAKVAPRFGISLAGLRAANGIRGKIRVSAGQTLLVPARNGGGTALAALPEDLRLPNADPPAAARVHVVRKGETLPQIARRTGVPLADLRRFNPLKGDKVTPGMRLALVAPAATPPAARAARPAAAPAPAARGVPARAVAAGKPVRKVTRYTIQRGDTLASIARRFNVGADDLQRWNRVSASQLRPGQTLTIQLARND